MSWKEFCESGACPRNYQNCSLEDLTVLTNSESTNFFKAAYSFINSPVPLILQGDPGRGKTYFMYCLIRGIFDMRRLHRSYIRFMNAQDLDERVAQEIKTYGSASYFISTLCDSDLLMIDDFGVESSKERAERNYYSLLDKRLANDRPMVISTNLTDEEILKIFGSRIDSRLKQCVKLVFDGPDLRKPKRLG